MTPVCCSLLRVLMGMSSPPGEPLVIIILGVILTMVLFQSGRREPQVLEDLGDSEKDGRAEAGRGESADVGEQGYSMRDGWCMDVSLVVYGLWLIVYVTFSQSHSFIVILLRESARCGSGSLVQTRAT